MISPQPEHQRRPSRPRPTTSTPVGNSNSATIAKPCDAAAGRSVQDVAAVQLADGQQVQGGGEHPHPGRPRYRVR